MVTKGYAVRVNDLVSVVISASDLSAGAGHADTYNVGNLLTAAQTEKTKLSPFLEQLSPLAGFYTVKWGLGPACY